MSTEAKSRDTEQAACELLRLSELATGGDWQDYLTETGRQHIVSHTEEDTLKLFSAMKDSGPADAGYVCWARNHAPTVARAYLELLEEKHEELEDYASGLEDEMQGR